MVLDVLLGKAAVVGLCGGDVEGNPQVGAGVGGSTRLGTGVDGLELPEGFGTEFCLSGSVLAEMGTDEHQRQEMCGRGLAFDLMTTIAVEAVEHVGILGVDGLILHSFDAVGEDGEQMVLCVLDEVGPDGIRSIIVQDGYLMAPDIGQQDINGPVDEWYGEFEGDLSMGPPHMGDGGFLTGEGTVLDAYPVIGLDAADGRYQTEVAPVVGARTDEGLHHDIWHRGRMSFYIKVET